MAASSSVTNRQYAAQVPYATTYTQRQKLTMHFKMKFGTASPALVMHLGEA